MNVLHATFEAMMAQLAVYTDITSKDASSNPCNKPELSVKVNIVIKPYHDGRASSNACLASYRLQVENVAPSTIDVFRQLNLIEPVPPLRLTLKVFGYTFL